MRLLLLLLIINSYQFIFSYNSFVNQLVAVKYFNSGQYGKALKEFKTLTIKYPKDPNYQFYLGACMVQTNTNLGLAVEYLKTASVKNVTPEIYKYLGKAYYNLFLFTEAREAYLKYKSEAGWRASISTEIKEIELAQSFFDSANIYKVLWKRQIFLPNLHKITDTLPDAQFVNLNSLNTSNFCHTCQPLYAKSPFPDSLVVLTINSDISSRGTDLQFYSKNTTLNITTNKQINSTADETWAYFDYNTMQLFFSSKGHNSIGGFDIFKTQWNLSNNTWSTPVNLDFPINSQFNDILLHFNSINNTLVIASNRECSDSLFTVYKLIYQNNCTKIKMYNSMDMLSESALNVSKLNTNQIKNTKTNIVEVKSFSQPLLYPADYLGCINLALKNQLSHDSLKSVISKYKNKLLTITDKSERATMYSEISVFENNAKTYQQAANKMFTNARNIETLNTFSHNNAFINPDTADNYKYADLNEFYITTKVMYTNNNTIPNNVILPKGLIYSIQLGVFSKVIDANHLGNMQPIFSETVNDGNIIKYYAGKFTKLKYAEEAQQKIYDLGNKNTFIIAFFNGKRITNDRALQLEKELVR